MRTALAVTSLLVPFLALAQPAPRPAERARPVRVHRGPGLAGMAHTGIPPQLAARLGIPEELQKRIQKMAFDANEQLIGLEAELKRAKLELQKQLSEEKPNQGAVMSQVDKVARAEAEVRKNRLGLLLRVREALGPELWRKLEAAMPMKRPPLPRGAPRGPFGMMDPAEPDDLEPELEE